MITVRSSMLLITSVTLFGLAGFFPRSAEAAKPRVQKTTAKTVSQTSYSTAKLSRTTNSISINFLNLTKVTKTDYSLSYVSGGIAQGVIGTITPTGTPSENRVLYFGTCSKNVCTPHTQITQATLVATSYLKQGGTYTKRYKIRL